MKNRLVKVVKGHCATWKIYEDSDGFYSVCNRRYGTLEAAQRAIRIAEQEYLRNNPNAPVVNTDIWFEHGILVVDSIDGGYYD